MDDIPGSFPNMTSLVQSEIWKHGKKEVCASAHNIITAKAIAAGRVLVKLGLVTVVETNGVLIFQAVAGKELDRNSYPKHPDNIGDWS